MQRIFTDSQIDFILDHYQDERYDWIGAQLGGFSGSQVGGWLRNNGYKKDKRNSIFTQEQKEFMAANYKIMAYKDIAQYLGFMERQVRGWINGNCQTKLRQYNKSYFENIDSPDKAYWLGFIYADGTVRCKEDTRNYELNIQLQLRDIDHLKKFSSRIGGEHQIVCANEEKYICGHEEPSFVESAQLRIYSKKWCQI